jgi:SAM-dependent methyltransferase
MRQPFLGLYATYYDALFPLDETELQFYRYFLQCNPGPALEIGCGTGSLLCALGREGFAVHGLDCSEPMLTIAARKAHQAGIYPDLYHQALETCDVARAFKTIYISSCSFMFITDHVQAQQTLARLYEQVLPGGQLIITSFLPYQEMMSGVLGRQCIHDVALDGQSQLTVYQTVAYDHARHVRTCNLDFELWRSGALCTHEHHTFFYRWYGVEELVAMIKAAGFSDVVTYGDYQLQPIVADAETLIVVARKK